MLTLVDGTIQTKVLIRDYMIVVVELILMIGLLLLTACRPVSAPSATPPAADEAAQPAAPPSAEAGAAIPVDLAAALASELGVEPGEMTIVSAEPVDWPDACLGVTRPDEMCGQVITPGYRVVLQVADTQYIVHTDSRVDGEKIICPAE